MLSNYDNEIRKHLTIKYIEIGSESLKNSCNSYLLLLFSYDFVVSLKKKEEAYLIV